MPFAKGRKKTGGRKKGIPGTVTASFSVAEACRAQGINPFEILAEMAAGKRFTADIRPAAETLCRYLQPQGRQGKIEARKAPAESEAERMARPEDRPRSAEVREQAAQGSLSRTAREVMVAGPSLD